MKKTLPNMIIIYFGSTCIGLLASVILDIPMKLIFPNTSDNLLSAIVGILGIIISIVIMSFMDGYNTKVFKPRAIIPSLLLVLLIILVLSILIGNAVYITGSTDRLVSYIIEKTNRDLYISNDAMDIVLKERYAILASVCAFVLVYSPLIIIAEYLGVKDRKNASVSHKY